MGDVSAADGPPPVETEAGRIILDISSIARWIGPPVGILRVEQALARYALGNPEITLSFYDKASVAFREINPLWAEHIVSWKGAIGGRRGALACLLPSPYSVVGVLERWRSTCASDAVGRAIGRLQRMVLLLRRPRRRGIVPFRLAIGRPLALRPHDVVISTGSDWTHKDALAIAALKQRFRFRHVVMCHDLIPLILPRYFLPEVVSAFRQYWTAMFALADLLLVYSRRVECDVRAHCRQAGIALGEMRLVPLGCDLASVSTCVHLPADLEPSHFILYVSTIEPRKGHGLLLAVWRRLLREGVPQRHRFKLVLVGRPGWLMDPILRQIEDAAAFGGTLVHLAGIDDEELASLYQGAAFCVYPSHYEGLGLPVLEAFAHGKAVIASTGGALPETVGGLSPCLDTSDEDAWCETLRRWIEDPALRAQYEARIRDSFSHPTWEQAASRIFAAVRGHTDL